MADIVLTGNTSGAITVAAPAVAGTNTLTLPANTGNIVTTGDSNTITQGMIASNVASTGPAFSGYMGSDLTITNGIFTKVPIDTEDFDTTSDFDSATNYRYTPSVAGYYQINATLRVVATSRTATLLSLYKNGSSYKTLVLNRESSSSSVVVSGSTLIYMNGSSDYIELYGYAEFSSGGRFDYSAPSSTCLFSAYLARAA